MQKFIDTETQEIISESSVKKRLSVPIKKTKIDLVPVPDIVEYDDDGNEISRTPQVPLEVPRAVSVSRTFGDLSAAAAGDLEAVGVSRIEFIETPKPEPLEFETVAAGELDKSEEGVWRTTWVVTDLALEDARAAKYGWLTRAATAAGAALKNGYPQWEIDGWHKQEAQSKEAIDGGTDTPLLDSLAASRGVDRLWLAGKISDKVGDYETAYGALCGKRQALETDIENASTLSELRLISW